MNNMRVKQSLCVLAILFVSIPAFAMLTPVGTYTLKFERTGWSYTKTMTVNLMEGDPSDDAEPFYQVGGQDVNVYMQYVGQYGYGDTISGYTWYVNAPAVLDDPASYSLLGGTGDLTITVSDFTLDDPNAFFVPGVTHIYYVGFNGDYVPLDIPGAVPVSPGSTQKQRTPIKPVESSEPGYNPSDPYYDTPYQDDSQPKLTFVLPEMYVPTGTPIYELSFGAGFMVPEPSILALLTIGFIGFIKKRR